MTKPSTAFLIIRRDNIGDLLCTTPLIQALRQRYPTARIDALVNSYNAPVLDGNPDLDHVYFYTKAKHRAANETVLGVYWRRIALLYRLRQVRYTRVFLAGDGNVERQMGLARWLNPGQVVGFVKSGSPLLPGLTVPLPTPRTGHEVERTWQLLGSEWPVQQPSKMRLAVSTRAREQAQDTLRAQAWYRPERPVVAIHISARKPMQRWPAASFSQLIRQIHATMDTQFMLFWSPGDEHNALHPGDDQKAAEVLSGTAGLPVQAYPTEQLEDLIGGLSTCQSIICSDGGAMHIAAALGLPMLCFFGNSDSARWHPWGVHYRLIQKESRKVEDISVDEAYSEYATLTASLSEETST